MAPVPASPAFDSPDARTADALLRSFGGRLFSYFRFMLGSESGAKRALSATLAAALPEAGRARDLESYGPRLFMLAHAECRKYQPAEAVGAGQHWTVVTGSGNPVLPEIARRAVARLAPDVREAYLLSAPYNHLTLPQMAEVLGVGLDAAADLRAQAGLDFVRAVALCATEAGFIQFGGSELRIRAEESLERDASEPPPQGAGPASPSPVPAAPPALPVQQQQQSPLRTALPPPSSLPAALPSSVALPPPSELPPRRRGPLPGPPVLSPPAGPAAFDGETFYDGEAFYDDAPPRHAELPSYGALAGSGRPEQDFRTSLLRTGPLRALTGPMMLGDDTPRGRRRRRVLAWTGGGVAAAAVAVIGWQVLAAAGPDNTITLTHGSLPTAGVPSGPAVSGPASVPPSPSHSPAASQSPTATATASRNSGAGTVSGGQTSGGTVPAPVAPRPAAGNQPAPAPSTHPAAPPPSSQSASSSSTDSASPPDSSTSPSPPDTSTASAGSSP